jgi:hypothetical protein
MHADTGTDIDSPDTDEVLDALQPDKDKLTGFDWVRILLYNNIYETGRFGGVANAIDGIKNLEAVIFQFNSLLAGFQMVSLVGGENDRGLLTHPMHRLTVFILMLGFVVSCSGCILSLFIMKYLILAREDEPTFAIWTVMGISPMIIASFAASIAGLLLLLTAVNTYAHLVLFPLHAFWINGVSVVAVAAVSAAQIHFKFAAQSFAYTRQLRREASAPQFDATTRRRHTHAEPYAERPTPS